MKPIDFLRKPVLTASRAPNPTQTAPQPHAATPPPAPQTIVRPPEIPPQVPKPRTGEYSRLMKRHDRLNTRHVNKKDM